MSDNQTRNMISNVGNPSGSNRSNMVIKPSELKKKIDDGDDFFILDVRTKQEHDMWSISYDKYRGFNSDPCGYSNACRVS